MKMCCLTAWKCFAVFALLCLGKDVINGQIPMPSCDEHEIYNLCEDPVNLGTFMSPEATRQCNRYVRPFIHESRLVTHDIIRLHTRPIIEFFSHQHNITQDENINSNLMSIFERCTNTHIYTSTMNPATNIYVKVSNLISVYNLLHCQLSDTLRRCHCLKFPDNLFQKIKSRLLGKLYLIQDKCGQYLEQQQCDVTLNLPFSSPVTCETLRDVIHTFLHHVLNTLLEVNEKYSAVRMLTR